MPQNARQQQIIDLVRQRGPRRGGGYAVRATLPVVDTAAPAVRGVP